MNIDTEFKKLATIFGMLSMLGLAYCQFVHNGKGRQFIKAVKPIQIACKKSTGCPSLPTGWKQIKSCGANYERTREFFPNGMKACAFLDVTPNTSYIYRTDHNNFLITWHYLSGSDLEAEGGVSHPLKVIKRFRGEKDIIIYDENEDS